MSCANGNCDCRGFSFEEIPPIIERMDNVRHAVSLMYVREKQWGFDSCNNFEDYESNKELDLYRRVLDRHLRFYYLGSKGSLKCPQLTNIVSRINLVLNLTPCQQENRVLERDDNDVDSWVLLNPNCVRRERWEFCALRKMPKLKLNVTPNNNCLNVVYELSKNDILCDISYDIESEVKNCRKQYNILKKEIDCELDYKLYKAVRDCGITDGIVRKILDCGMKFGWSTKDAQPCIISGTDELLLGELNEINI